MLHRASRRDRTGWYVAAALAIAAAACEQVSIVTVDVASIEVEPSAVTLERGESRMLSAVISAEDGRALDRLAIEWSSTNAAVAEVEADGRVTAIAAGTARIVARVDGVEGGADVSVMEPPPQYTIPAAPTQLRADAHDEDEIRLTWRDNANDETDYLLQRRDRDSGNWNYQLQLPANTKQHRDRGLEEDQRYWYRVLACNPAGCSASEVVSERTEDD